mmetsp:Transcript_5224/g.14787  ORF Transcript_5224/g.14787 Transcript_5224/m.14787 type:complete len:272 (-) Transcript_5224:256-1071(-)
MNADRSWHSAHHPWRSCQPIPLPPICTRRHFWTSAYDTFALHTSPRGGGSRHGLHETLWERIGGGWATLRVRASLRNGQTWDAESCRLRKRQNYVPYTSSHRSRRRQRSRPRSRTLVETLHSSQRVEFSAHHTPALVRLCHAVSQLHQRREARRLDQSLHCGDMLLEILHDILVPNELFCESSLLRQTFLLERHMFVLQSGEGLLSLRECLLGTCKLLLEKFLLCGTHHQLIHLPLVTEHVLIRLRLARTQHLHNGLQFLSASNETLPLGV